MRILICSARLLGCEVYKVELRKSRSRSMIICQIIKSLLDDLRRDRDYPVGFSKASLKTSFRPNVSDATEKSEVHECLGG